MAARTIINIFQHKTTGLWIAGYNRETGAWEWSPKIQDAMLFYGWSSNYTMGGPEYRRETIEIKKFRPSPPRARKTKKKSAPKAKKSTATGTKRKSAKSKEVVEVAEAQG